jgi:hypothetical protein
MEQKKQTALMRAIQRAKDTHNYYVDESLKDTYTQREQELLYVKSIALAEFIDTLAELLPVEKEQMKGVWKGGDINGRMDERGGKIVDFETYYNKNYGE